MQKNLQPDTDLVKELKEHGKDIDSLLEEININCTEDEYEDIKNFDPKLDVVYLFYAVTIVD